MNSSLNLKVVAFRLFWFSDYPQDVLMTVCWKSGLPRNFRKAPFHLSSALAMKSVIKADTSVLFSDHKQLSCWTKLLAARNYSLSRLNASVNFAEKYNM